MLNRILIVDDHVAVRQGLERIMAQAFPSAEISTAGTTQEVLDKVGQTHYNLVILDLSLPGRGGLELIRQIKDLNPDTGVLIYTVYPDEQLGVRCLKSGADGYVTKDRPVEDLVEAVARIAQGRKYVSPQLAEILADSLSSKSGGSPLDTLSDRELQVLKMIAGGKSPSEIASDLHLSIKTVSTYRGRLLDKLNLSTTADLIRYALEQRLL